MNSARVETLGYVVETVLSPGPIAFVALARRPDGAPCVIKTAAIARGIPMLENEKAALRALAAADTAGVPKLLEAWEYGFALAQLRMPTLRQHGEAIRRSHELRGFVAHRAFERLAEVHNARNAAGAALAMVHGDISPDNVYVAVDGSQAALADFGLARWNGGPREEAGGAFRGTLLYVAPEIARGEPFDGRADDFALAASLLHIATGIPLHEWVGSDAAALVEAGSRPLDASHPWRALAPRLFNLTVAEALLACLAFDARDRPRDSAAVLSVWG